MAREIKFRAKNTKNEWVCGHYAELATQGDYLTPSIIDNGFVNVVNPETLCQYTGLTDKDGKEIYEGDVVQIPCDRKCIIKYADHISAFVLVEIGGNKISNNLLLKIDYASYEVIGNIHENPELID